MYKVFIVEDDPMVLNINIRFTEKVDGFEVVGTSRVGKNAVNDIISKTPDLVLLDVFLQDQSGLTLLQEIRATQYYPEVIMITAANDAETIEKAFKLGAFDYIVKPYGFARFEKSLESFAQKIVSIKNKSTEFSQIDIDEINFTMMNISKESQGTSKLSEYPKGIDEITLDLIKEAVLKSKVPVSSGDMADSLRLSRITTRKYLEYLADEKIIKVDLKYGNSGRPTRLFFNPDFVDLNKFNVY
ncbi:MAG: response regulator [Sedimentibacter sp.]